MTHEQQTYLAIFLMGVVTYATRITGPVIIRFFPDTPRVRAGLAAIPGAIMASLIAPTIANAGTAEMVASAVVILCAFRKLPLLLSIIIGVGTLLLVRSVAG